MRRSSDSFAPRAGFTLVELLVVIAIIGVLVSLMLPAINGAREAGRGMSCTNNVKNIALAVANHESQLGYMPTSGETKIWPDGAATTSTASTDVQMMQSFFQVITPYTENTAIATKWNNRRPYWHPTANSSGVSNLELAKTNIPLYRCASSTADESNGATLSNGNLGITDYMVLAYTDLNFDTGSRDKTLGGYCEGALSGIKKKTISACTDGTSRTSVFSEASSRAGNYAGKRFITLAGGTKWYELKAGVPTLMSSADADWVEGTEATGASIGKDKGTGTGKAGCSTRPGVWADSDNGSGVSGNPKEETLIPRTLTIINNIPKNAVETAACSGNQGDWTANNIGSNDEIWTQHAAARFGMVDGSVQTISTGADWKILHCIVNPADGQVVGLGQ